MGNSILQSGAALGAVVTPGIVLGLTTSTGTWQLPFFAIGAIGLTWVVAGFPAFAAVPWPRHRRPLRMPTCRHRRMSDRRLLPRPNSCGG